MTPANERCYECPRCRAVFLASKLPSVSPSCPEDGTTMMLMTPREGLMRLHGEEDSDGD